MTITAPSIPQRDTRITNPYHAVKNLTPLQHAIFWSGWLAWIADSYDFFCVSLTVLRLNDQFNQNTHSLTTAITLTLLLRPVGAAIFGILSDRYGRKWPLVSVLLIIAALQTGTGFVTTFREFLAVRSLFGIAMGGVWGLASAASMESMPVSSRGLYSGIMQTGYPGGYLLATVVNLFLVPKVPETWRTIYWVGAGISAVAAFFRAILPESGIFTRSRNVAQGAGINGMEETRVFIRSLEEMLKRHWKIWVYGVVLMSGMNFLAHGSQDLYTTFMQNSKGFSADDANKANIIGETGAVLGALFGGFVSQILGRRITLIVACLWCCAFIPLWIIPSTWGSLTVGAFFFQSGVNIAWGTIAVHLNELAPPAFRGLYPGTVYQLGNMASAAAAQIEATAGLSIRLTINGQDQPDYGKIQAIVAAASCGLVLVCALLGPERHSADLTNENTAIEQGTVIMGKELKVKTAPTDSLDKEEKQDVLHIEDKQDPESSP
ncbi:MFS general substrate transporter [Dendrothele bispora CBS 962.96]|uniref:MFS general substrate transporter n=1 Tax=Dendrothele bispora (strain CBS 962.96) TaxID=1314807 RepID=A0A4S8MRX4_DENBC|nr:MFS general substrate transporter [Dendrothele bispora CBS 962.96]